MAAAAALGPSSPGRSRSWEMLQDQQLGLAQALIKSLLSPWVSLCV